MEELIMVQARTAIICGTTESYVKSFILRVAEPLKQPEDNAELNHGEYHEIKIDRLGNITKSEAPAFSLRLTKKCGHNCKLENLKLSHTRVLVFLLTPNIILNNTNTESVENPTKDEGLTYQRQFYEKFLSENQDFLDKYAGITINVIPYKMNDCGSSEQVAFINQVRKFQNELAISMSKKDVNRNVILLITENFASIQSSIKYQLVTE